MTPWWTQWRRWRPGRTDLEAHVALVAGTFVARLLLAVVVFVLALVYLVRAHAFDAGTSDTARTGLAVLGMLVFSLVLTIGHVAWTGLRDLSHNLLPAAPALFLGAALDVWWLMCGFVVTGNPSLPFPPLLILAIGVHGVLLTAPWVTALTVLASVAVTAAYVWIGATPGISPEFPSTTQAAFLVGTGVVSALVGNRIRAAGGTVAMLTETVRRLTSATEDILASLPMGVLVISADAEARLANPALSALLDTPAGDGAAALDRLGAADPTVHEAVTALASPRTGDTHAPPRSGECTLAGRGADEARTLAWIALPYAWPDASRLRVSALGAPGISTLRDAAPPATVPAILLLVTDVTDRQQSLALRQRAAHFAAVATLSAGLAHEVRNPIAALQSAADQLRERATLEAADTDHLLEILSHEADRLNHLVTEFLEFARVGGGDVGAHQVRDLIAEATRAVAGHPELVAKALTLAVDAPDLTLHTDADLVYRVLSNLLLNAVAFSPVHGTITVTALVRAPGRTRGRTLVLTVHDDGPGVAPAVRDRLFSPFVTTRPHGTGLGLAIAARAATLAGGELRHETPPGDGQPTGATFTLVLPLDPALA